MITFAHERVADIFDEVMPLAYAHWLESDEYRYYQDVGLFCPSRARYQQAEDNGVYFHFCARDGARLVGSAGIYIMPSMHTQRLIAREDTFYLLPEYRGRGRSVFRFVAFTEDFARERGVEQFMLTTAISNATSERVVEFMGYARATTGWVRNLQVNAQQKVA